MNLPARSFCIVVLIASILILLVPTRAGLLPAHAAGLPGISVSGNRLVDANGNTVILHGVNRSGSEYACIQGWGIFDGPNLTNDDSQVPLMKSWDVNEVNIGINEDCWLGINGVPAAYGGANYISAIQHEVATLESYNIYPVISLFWEAAGGTQATDQIAMPDNDHAPAVWQSVATTFKNDPRVILRLKEEPYPAGNTDGASAWQCWKNGDVQYDASGSLTPVSSTANCSEGYKSVGMQSLVNIIRGTGATNVIQVPGVEYANSMTHFLDTAYRVSDTLSTPQLMGVVDVYPVGNICGSTTCYSSEYAPVIQQMPFLAGEFGESVDGSACGTTNVDALMQWFDQHNAGYSAWSWDTWGACLQLISSYSTGAPNGNWGTDYKNHLLSLASATPVPTSTGSAPTNTPPAGSPTPTASPSSNLVLYDNGVASGFTDGSFGYSAANSCDTSLSYSPPCSYAITYTAWGGVNFQVDSGNLNTSGYTSLQYDLYTNGQPIADFGALLTDTSGAVINEIALSSADVTTLSGGWVQASLPISQINPSNVGISTIQLKNEINGNLATVHYDDVMLVGSGASSTPTSTSTATSSPTPRPTSTPTRTAAPTSTPTSVPSPLILYDNAVAPGFNDGTFGYSSRNPCDASVFYSAPCSYAITYTASGGIDFQVASGSLSTAAYTTLQYKLNPNGQPISDFGALFTNTSGGVVKQIALGSKYVKTLSNGWQQVSIPVSQLNPSHVLISTIQLKNQKSTSLKSVHVDDVRLSP
jgi:Cellulase (glycosyl hydrolase family 5)